MTDCFWDNESSLQVEAVLTEVPLQALRVKAQL